MQTVLTGCGSGPQNKRLDSFGSWREYIPDYPGVSGRRILKNDSVHITLISEELHIEVTATEDRRPKYIDILPLLLLNIQYSKHFKYKVTCEGRTHATKPPFGCRRSIFHTEFTDEELGDSLRCILFRKNAKLTERLSRCRYALQDLYHERHLVMLFPGDQLPDAVASGKDTQAGMGLDDASSHGLLTIDMHCLDDFTGLAETVVPEHKSMQDEEGTEIVPWIS